MGLWREKDIDNTLTFLQNVTLTHSWFISENLTWNPTSWSISVEWLLYLLFPGLALLFSKARAIPCTLGILALVALVWIITYDHIHISSMYLPPYSIFRGVLNFLIGMCLHNLFQKGFLKGLPWDAISILCVGCIFAMLKFNPEVIAYIPVFTLLVYALANIKGYANYIFSNRAAVYLGDISYSIYMWHFIYILLFQQYFRGFWKEHNFFGWEYWAMVSALLVIASLSYHIIEVPSRKLLQALVRRKKVTSYRGDQAAQPAT